MSPIIIFGIANSLILCYFAHPNRENVCLRSVCTLNYLSVWGPSISVFRDEYPVFGFVTLLDPLLCGCVSLHPLAPLLVALVHNTFYVEIRYLQISSTVVPFFVVLVPNVCTHHFSRWIRYLQIYSTVVPFFKRCDCHTLARIFAVVGAISLRIYIFSFSCWVSALPSSRVTIHSFGVLPIFVEIARIFLASTCTTEYCHRRLDIV